MKVQLVLNYLPIVRLKHYGKLQSSITHFSGKEIFIFNSNHSFPLSLRRPEDTRKRPVLPRFNSTFRYTGTYTYHQARQLLLDRPNPDFERSLSKRMAKSLDVCKYFLLCL